MELFKVYPLFAVEPVHANGCYVYDKEGQAYLDFYGGHAVISIGHSHPHYIEKITEQLQRIGFYSNSVLNGLQEELAGKLGRLSKCDQYQLFLCNSGAEANENALKMASWQTGRTKIIAFQKGFHGRTSAAVRVTDKTAIQAPINQGFEVEFHPLNELTELARSLAKQDVAAVITEGVQGIAGINIPEASFLSNLSELCRKYETPLVLDEIQSGYGRTGKFFAFQHAGIEPDMITMAKGMGNGFPIGGVLLHPKYQAKYGMLGTTFGGNHLACAAGIAVLDVMKEEYLMDNANTQGQYFKRQLRQIEGVKEIRGLGLMIGIEYEFPIAPLRNHLIFEEKVFTGSASNPNVLRILPPLSIGKIDVDIFVKKLKKATHQYLAKLKNEEVV